MPHCLCTAERSLTPVLPRQGHNKKLAKVKISMRAVYTAPIKPKEHKKSSSKKIIQVFPRPLRWPLHFSTVSLSRPDCADCATASTTTSQRYIPCVTVFVGFSRL